MRNFWRNPYKNPGKIREGIIREVPKQSFERTLEVFPEEILKESLDKLFHESLKGILEEHS